MRRLIWFAATVLVLVGAGIAVAHDNNGKSIKQVSAAFTAATASNVRTDTCTASDGTYTTTHGRWTGTATGDLSGTATIDAEIAVNPAGDGTVSGKLRIDGTDHTVAQFDAVIGAGGNLAGVAEGHGSANWNKLIANLSANWSATGGFTGGKLGGATTGGNAVEVSSGGCRPVKPPKPDTIELRGAITIGTGTVTVAGVTCTVPSTLTTDVAKLSSGDHVDLTCTVSGGVNTLSHVEGDHHH